MTEQINIINLVLGDGVSETDALILIDIQNDFLETGALPVSKASEILPVVHRLGEIFDNIILTQDWHPAEHASFASNHSAPPFATTMMPYGEQVLWPDHCIMGRHGAEFALEAALVNKAQAIIRKGFRPQVDSYSAFWENDKTTSTGLAGMLKERGIKRLFFAGLALDYCVADSALDAAKLGFESFVIVDACRGIALDQTGTLDMLEEFGVQVLR